MRFRRLDLRCSGAESINNNPSPTVIDTRKTGGENLKAIDAIAVHLNWLYAISREGGIHCLGATLEPQGLMVDSR